MQCFSSSEVSKPMELECISRVALTHLRAGLAAPLAMTERVHVCCRPFFSARASNWHFVLFIETGLVCRFVFSFFSLQPLPHTTAPRLFVEVCLVEAEWKIFMYFAILWQLVASEMRHVKQLPQKEISNLQVQTKVREKDLLCNCAVSYS